MKKTICLVHLLLIATGCGPEPPSSSEIGRIIELEIPAPSLTGNMLGDPAVQPISVYLPPSYDVSDTNRYPVIYLLHGWNGTNRTWMIAPELIEDGPLPVAPGGSDYGVEGKLKSDRIDAIIAGGTIPEVIIVAPNGRNAYKHSFYVNSPVTGNWEDYVVTDVVGYVDAHFRTLPESESRGIAGHSGGGNGALYVAMRNADVFGSVYAMAPCCSGPDFSLPAFYPTDSGQLSGLWQDVFTRTARLEAVEDLPPSSFDPPADFYINVELAAAAAYAPNPDRPPLFADPLYELEGGELTPNASAFERRRSKSIYHMIGAHEDDLRSLNGILIDYGEHEMVDLSAGNASFAKSLAERGIPFELEVYSDGDHGSLVTDRLEVHGFAFFASVLAFGESMD